MIGRVFGRPHRVALVVFAFLLSFTACDGGFDAAQRFKGEAAKRITDVSHGFDEWDRVEQDRVRAAAPVGEKLAALDVYIAKVQTPIRKAILALKGALAAFSAALDAYAAGVKSDWLGTGLAVVRAGAELLEALRQCGVNVPFAVPAFFGGG